MGEEGLDGPVLADEAGHAAEVTEIAGNDCCSGFEGDGGNSKVVLADIQFRSKEALEAGKRRQTESLNGVACDERRRSPEPLVRIEDMLRLPARAIS